MDGWMDRGETTHGRNDLRRNYPGRINPRAKWMDGWIGVKQLTGETT